MNKFNGVPEADILSLAIQRFISYGLQANIDDEMDFYDSYNDLVDSAIADALDHYRRDLLAPMHQHIKALFDENKRKQLKDIVIEATMQRYDQTRKGELVND